MHITIGEVSGIANLPFQDLYRLLLRHDVINIVSNGRIVIQQLGSDAPYHTGLGLVESRYITA